MAYSSMNADGGAEDDEPAVLGSGGAIMAALEQNSKPKKQAKKTKLKQKPVKSSSENVQTTESEV